MSRRESESEPMAQNSNELMDKLVALCKRRGFIFQSSEIYGGINGFWDYGPLGVELKRNIKDAWWEDIVRKRDDMVGLDCSIIMNPKVWEASGHVGGFADKLLECSQCRGRFRADKVYFVHGFGEAFVDGAQAAMEYLRRRPEAVVEDRANELYILALEGESPHEVADNAPRKIMEIAKERNVAVLKKCAEKPGSRATLEHRRVFFLLGDKEGSVSVVLIEPASIAAPHNARPCPKCGANNSLSQPRNFNLMFKSHAGASEDSASVVYLRPETAQGIFANYKNVLDTSRMKVPFGIAQIGKAFRNEINPRNYTFRSREFEQMEIEFFCHPNEADKWYEYWRDARFQWYVGLGLRSERLRLRNHEAEELAHYAKSCADIEYEFPFGTAELEGVANRTDFDLTQHQKFSGRDMTYFDPDGPSGKERFIPYVIEPSGGIDRAALAFLCEAYCEDEAPDEKGVMQKRVVMKLHPRLAPVKVAVFPLVKRDGMDAIARRIHEQVRASGVACFYDEKGAIGRRYRRQDEAGTPFCVTVDGQTLQDDTVTIRDRDSLAQQRIGSSEVVAHVKARIC